MFEPAPRVPAVACQVPRSVRRGQVNGGSEAFGQVLGAPTSRRGPEGVQRAGSAPAAARSTSAGVGALGVGWRGVRGRRRRRGGRAAGRGGRAWLLTDPRSRGPQRGTLERRAAPALLPPGFAMAARFFLRTALLPCAALGAHANHSHGRAPPAHSPFLLVSGATAPAELCLVVESGMRLCDPHAPAASAGACRDVCR